MKNSRVWLQVGVVVFFGSVMLAVADDRSDHKDRDEWFLLCEHDQRHGFYLATLASFVRSRVLTSRERQTNSSAVYTGRQ
jgi:hypothetical protein